MVVIAPSVPWRRWPFSANSPHSPPHTYAFMTDITILSNFINQERGGNAENTGQFSGHKNTSPEASATLKPALTVKELRARIKRAQAKRDKADVEVKEAAVQAVRILAAERFPDAAEVEFHKEYNEPAFTVIRANDAEGDTIWESFDPSTHPSASKMQDKSLQQNMDGLMRLVGGDAPRFLPRVKDMVGETVVFRF